MAKKAVASLQSKSKRLTNIRSIINADLLAPK